MKFLPFVLAVAAAAGCADGPARAEYDNDMAQVRKDLMKVSTRADEALMFDKEIMAKQVELNEQVKKLDNFVKVMEATLARLEDSVRTLQTAPEPKLVNGDTQPPPGPKPAKNLTIEEVLQETERALSALRKGTLSPEKVAAQLLPHARICAPRLVDEMAKAITQLDYTRQLETILGKMPAADLKVPLQRALTSLGTRSSAAAIVGLTENRELSAILEPHASALDENFVLAVGESLARCRNAAGIPLLVRCLKSQESSTRTIAIDVLRKLNRDNAFGYRPAQSPDANIEAIKSWEEWAEKLGKTLFD